MSTRRARRVERSYRCARCGFQAAYPAATVKEARHWFSKHSCQKRERLMLREVMAAIREEAIDRTPQPCLHKKANHQHGQRATYVLDACRCIPCSKANAAAENERERMKAYGRYHKYVDAYPVRLHLAELKEYGIGLKQVGRLSGVSNGSLTKIWYGLYGPAEGPHKGCKGNGDLLRGPARRVLRTTAERIYAVEAIPQNLSAGVADHERTPLAKLHLRALVALGWSQSKLAARLEVERGNFIPIIRDGRTLSRGMVDKIEALYDELSMMIPPHTEHRDRIAYSRALNYAAAAGWLPPLALEDVDESSPEDADLDEVAIERRMAGDKSVALTKPEKHELARRWRNSGRPLNELERVTGLHSQRYRKTEQEQAS